MKTKKNLDRQQPIKTCGNCGSYVDGEMSSDGYCDLCRNVGKTKTEHSPGPWKINGTSVETNDCIICELPEGGDGSATETEANASLIAAAPELLDAAKVVLSFLENNGLLKDDEIDGGFLWGAEKLIAAIAKAEGGK